VAVVVDLGELAGRPLFGVSDAELRAAVDEAFAARAVLDGFVVTAVRELDGRGLAVADGATSTTAWLTGRQRVSGSLAASCVRVAKATDATVTAEALRAGRVNLEQAQAIARALADMPAQRRDEAENVLLEQAVVFGPRELRLLGARIGAHLDTAAALEGRPPGPAELAAARQLGAAEQRAVAKRELWLSEGRDGGVRVSGWLDPEAASAVRTVTDSLCRPCPADRLEPRTPAHRRADALVEVFELVAASGRLPRNGGDPVQVAVTVPWTALRDGVGAATLDDGTTLSPAAARRLACDAGLIPAVLGGASQSLDVGRQRRLFTGPLRRAVLLRDGGCAFPGCDRAPKWTVAHHVIHWAEGGATCLANAVAVCGHHHRIIHYGQWKVTINPTDGLPDFWPPDHLGISGPLRNRRNGP
jgi:hypothetical protein